MIPQSTQAQIQRLITSLSESIIDDKQTTNKPLLSARLIPAILAGYALVHVLFIVFLWINHIAFPLNLEAMELTVLEHLKRVMTGLPLYPEPSSDFVALAYNPLYYFLAVPFAWIFGSNLFTLRLVAILGMLGAGIVIFLAVRRETNSNWWAIIAVGLFAAAYRAMDTYLDTAHSDSWLLFSILLGCYLIDQKRSRLWNLTGVFLMICAFWFKQHGAIFAIGAVTYLIWRDGWKKSWLYLTLATVLGPGLYFGVPDWLLGSHFHYFTWQVPSQWTQFSFGTIYRLIRFVGKYYCMLAILGGIASINALLKRRNQINIWYFMLSIAALSALMGALDPGGNENVFIPMGSWFIITGILALQQWMKSIRIARQWNLHLSALVISFVLLVYNPISVIVSPQANTAYQDLIGYLKSLDGTVYAPWLGQLQDGYKFYPTVHAVPLADIVRGPRFYEPNHSTIKKLLEPVLNPKGKAYLLMNYPLLEDNMINFLTNKYTLETDLGNRFESLKTLPRRYFLYWPRYLYRYKPE